MVFYNLGDNAHSVETAQVYNKALMSGVNTNFAIRGISNVTGGAPATKIYEAGKEYYQTGSTTGVPDTPTTRGTIGGGYNNYYLTGHFCEFMWWNRILTRDERVHAEQYMAAKWGVTIAQEVLVACDGDSITLGVWVSEQASTVNSYPSKLQLALGSGYNIKNFGVGSQTLPNMTADAATQIDAPFASTLVQSILVQNGGVNDIYTRVATEGKTAAAAAAAVIADWETYVTDRQAAGWQVVSLTIIAIASGIWTATMETARGLVNAHITASSLPDAVVDLAAMSEFSDANDATYYQSDKVHPTAVGNGVISAAVDAAISSL